MQKHKKRRESVSEKLYAHELSQKNIFPRDIKNFIKMLLPKLSIPPPITFITVPTSNIENYSAKNGRRGWGRKRKTDFFFLPPAISQVNRELRQKLRLTSVLLSTAFITFRKKNINTIKSDMICTEAGRKTKVCQEKNKDSQSCFMLEDVLYYLRLKIQVTKTNWT